MLRTIPRCLLQYSRSLSSPWRKGDAVSGLATMQGARQSVAGSARAWGSWTASTSRQQLEQRQHASSGTAKAAVVLLERPMSSAAAYGARGRRKVSENASQWGAEGLPVAPVLGDREKLPANLKLAAEAWPEGEDDEEGDEEGDEENEGGEFEDDSLSDNASEDIETLSDEDRGAIDALGDSPAFAGTEVDVTSWAEGTSAGQRTLNPDVFGVPMRRDVVHDVVRWQLAKRRSGNAVTKRIGEISGSGRKVRPQKGGGSARAGHSRPPHWRGGAKAHGPRTKDWSFKLNKKFVKLGLRVALSARLREGKLKVVDDIKCDTFSTSGMLKKLQESGLTDNVTFIVGGDPQPELLRSTNNLVGVKVLAARGANVYDIIKRPSLVVTEDAVAHLEEALGPK